MVSANATARSVYGEMLGELGFQVSQAHDLETAADSLRTAPAGDGHRPGLAVVDVLATQSLDVATVESLQRASDDGELIAAFLLPAGRVELVEQCRQLGLANCLIKPIKQVELAKVINDAMGTQPQPAAGESPEQAMNSRPLRILVADDSPFNQQVAAGLLELNGHAVSLADDGREAVERFKQEPLDIIFMDLEMPNLDGLAATRMIRELELATGTHVGIVGLSAHALVGFREKSLEAGMDTYITKPIHPDELYAALVHAAAPAAEVLAGGREESPPGGDGQARAS